MMTLSEYLNKNKNNRFIRNERFLSGAQILKQNERGFGFTVYDFSINITICSCGLIKKVECGGEINPLVPLLIKSDYLHKQED